MTTLQFARKYEDLLAGDTEGDPYDYATMFKGEGFFAQRRARKRFKLLKLIDHKLREILQPEEKAYFITPGTTMSLSEHLFVGWWAYYLNMRALVFTSNRVLLLQIDIHQRPAELVSQMPYASIASVKSTWTGLCRVKLINHKAYNFQNVPRADRKFLAEFLTGMVQGTSAPFQKSGGIEHLCPHCFSILPGHPRECPTCGGGIKSAGKAALLSLLIPGAGDWYLGHRVFALIEMLGAAFLWFGLVIVPLLAPPAPHAAPMDRAFWLTNGLILLAAHCLDSALTYSFARKGHHPTGVGRRFTVKATVAPTADLPKPDVMNAARKLAIKRPPA